MKELEEKEYEFHRSTAVNLYSALIQRFFYPIYEQRELLMSGSIVVKAAIRENFPYRPNRSKSSHRS